MFVQVLRVITANGVFCFHPNANGLACSQKSTLDDGCPIDHIRSTTDACDFITHTSRYCPFWVEV